jgi:hypothetical protein
MAVPPPWKRIQEEMWRKAARLLPDADGARQDQLGTAPSREPKEKALDENAEGFAGFERS